MTTDGDSGRDGEAGTADAAFGWRGWVLLGMLFVSFVLVPLVLAALAMDPGLVGTFGLGFRDAYLVIPLVPGALLGAVAVWAAVSRS